MFSALSQIGHCAAPSALSRKAFSPQRYQKNHYLYPFNQPGKEMPETGELLRKLQAFCANRERCSAEVTEKLMKLGADEEQIEPVITALRTEAFLDDQRFCSAYVRNALEKKKLGRNRIYEELKNKEISEAIILHSLELVSEESQKKLIIEEIINELQKSTSPIGPEFTLRLIRKLARQGFDEEEVLAQMRILSNIDI